MADLREKISLRGIESLDDEELLTLLVESEELSQALLQECGSLEAIARTPIARLRMVAAAGTKRAEKIAAAVEIGRRVANAEKAIEQTITSSDDVVTLMRPLLQDLKHEECWVLFLTNSNRIIERTRFSQGGVQATVVDQRLIVKRALELLSTRIIVLHNHPSGSVKPSEADFTLTRRIREATQLFDIELLDHIIISNSESYSFKSNNKL